MDGRNRKPMSNGKLAAACFFMVVLLTGGISAVCAEVSKGMAAASLPTLAVGAVMAVWGLQLAWRVVSDLWGRYRTRSADAALWAREGGRDIPVRYQESRQAILSGAFEGLRIWRTGGRAFVETRFRGRVYLDRQTVEEVRVLQEEQVRGARVSPLRVAGHCLLIGLLGDLLLGGLMVAAESLVEGLRVDDLLPEPVVLALALAPFVLGAVHGARRPMGRRVYTVELQLLDGRTCVAEVDTDTLRALEDPSEGLDGVPEEDGPAGGPAPDGAAAQDDGPADGPRWGTGHRPEEDGGESRWDGDPWDGGGDSRDPWDA